MSRRHRRITRATRPRPDNTVAGEPLPPANPQAAPSALWCADDAVEVIRHALDPTIEHQSAFLPLDHRRVGGTIVVINEITDDDNIVDCVEMVALAAKPRFLVMAPVRGGLVVDDDFDRWIDASMAAVAHGCELLDWLIIDHRRAVSVPDTLGFTPADQWAPPRQ